MTAARTACITAGGRGIGRATALELAAAGWTVHVSDIDAEAAAAVAAEVEAAGGVAFAERCDVSDEASVDELVASIKEGSGRLDSLIANAGIYPKLAFRDTTVSMFDRIFAVNVRGAFLCTMAALPLLEASEGSIVYLSSGAGTLAAIAQPMAGSLPVYGASKAALDRWALGIAGELAASGVAANVLYPGAVVLTDGTTALRLTPEELASAIEPEAVAPAIVWLAGQRAWAMSGQLVRAVEFGSTWGPVPTERG